MADTIRHELGTLLAGMVDGKVDELADYILSSSVVARIRAEAWDEGYMAVPADPEDREAFIEDADNPYRSKQ